MQNIEGHLFVNRYFIEYNDELLSTADYYVIRNNIAYHVHAPSKEETFMGEPDPVFLSKSCKDLGIFSVEKVKQFDSTWITKDRLFSLLKKNGYITKKHNKALEHDKKDAA